MTLIIGFSGPMYAGKDTACEHLTDILAEHGKTVLRVGFADALKVSACRALGMEPESPEQARAWCDQLKEGGELSVQMAYDREEGQENALFWEFSGRQFLQWYGTEAHRDVFGEDFWVDVVLPPNPEGLEYYDERDGYTVDVLAISDVRFESEARRILSYPNGRVVRIVRPHRPEAQNVPAHASEAGLDDSLITDVLSNDAPGGPESLRPAVEVLARQLDLIP
jgi:hypothetical protein